MMHTQVAVILLILALGVNSRGTAISPFNTTKGRNPLVRTLVDGWAEFSIGHGKIGTYFYHAETGRSQVVPPDLATADPKLTLSSELIPEVISFDGFKKLFRKTYATPEVSVR